MSKKNRSSERAERAAAALREQQRHERRRRNLMVGGVVAVILVVVVGGYLLSRSLDTTTEVDAPSAGSTYGLTIGAADAPHDVVIYEDFLCPYCGQLESATRDKLASLAADGKVRVEYRPFNLLSSAGDYSARSAGAFSIVLDKSGAGVAKKFHDLLYENQPDESGPFPDNGALVDLAVQAGAQRSAVQGPIEGQDGKSWVTKATQSALDAGVRGTPTVLLDGTVFEGGTTMADTAQALLDEVS